MNEKHISFSTCKGGFEYALSSLNELAEKFSIPTLNIRQTIDLFTKSLETGILKGRSKHLILLSSLYVICRQSDIHLSLHEIADTKGVSAKNLARCARILMHSFDIRWKSYDYSSMVNRISDSLKLREELRRDALNFLIKANEKGAFVGKRPLTIAATVVYISCKINKERKPLWKISEVSGIHNVTIRNNAKHIYKLLDVNRNADISYPYV